MSETTRTALVRRPTASIVDGIVTHAEPSSVDAELALQQWTQYVEAMAAHGWTTIEVPADDACPDAVFIEDTAVVFGQTAMICRPGDDTRKPEVAPVAEALAGLGYRLDTIEAEGTLDGGDAMLVGTTMYIGRGGRTNEAGIDQARAILGPLGVEVVSVPNTLALHLKSAVTALPNGRVIGYEPVVTDPGVFGGSEFSGVEFMPEEPGAHVVDLGDGNVLMSTSAPRSAERIADMGFTPVTVDMGEFEKLDGCVTCLSIRLRNLPA